jgi:hypothetical protein
MTRIVSVRVIILCCVVPEAYAERAEIYIKLCDFSSAISNFKKALSFVRCPNGRLSSDSSTL